MRSLYMFNMVTLDGYFEGAGHDLSWHLVDEEFQEFAIDQLRDTGLLVFGRLTFQLMAGFWPTEAAIKNDPIVAGQMNSLPKVVFSRTMERAEWNNTRLIRDNAESEIAKLKQQPGRDIGLLGSFNLAKSLIDHDLIDEFRLLLNPVVIGDGVSSFKGIDRKIRLRLLRSKTFRSGNVLLVYGKGE